MLTPEEAQQSIKNLTESVSTEIHNFLTGKFYIIPKQEIHLLAQKIVAGMMLTLQKDILKETQKDQEDNLQT